MAQTQPESIVKANSVIGVKVLSANKEKLGEIEEIMIDKLSGETEYVVLSFGGILGMGEKLFALPWQSISYSVEDEGFIVNLDKETLKKAPGFNKNNWPDMADPIWKQTMQSYYGDLIEKTEDIKDTAKDTIERGVEEVKKSGEDWLEYIQDHPIQSIGFGIFGYFALKGLMKEVS